MTLFWYALVAIVGDSHAAGQPGHLLAAALRAQGHTVVVQGRVGARANTTRWSCKADWQIAFLGSNEALDELRLQAYRDIGGRHHHTIIVGPPASSRRRVKAAAQALSEAGILRFIDSRKCTDVKASTDGLHYAGAGAAAWVGCLLRHPLLGGLR